MNWKPEEAQQRFSELISAAIEEPQLIYDQNQWAIKLVCFPEFGKALSV